MKSITGFAIIKMSSRERIEREEYTMENIINIINAIPENMGWAMVGILAGFTTMALWKVIKVVAEMVADHLTNDWEEEEE